LTTAPLVEESPEDGDHVYVPPVAPLAVNIAESPGHTAGEAGETKIAGAGFTVTGTVIVDPVHPPFDTLTLYVTIRGDEPLLTGLFVILPEPLEALEPLQVIDDPATQELSAILGDVPEHTLVVVGFGVTTGTGFCVTLLAEALTKTPQPSLIMGVGIERLVLPHVEGQLGLVSVNEPVPLLF
jgi:hypothetical protein